jgi:3-phenylpropionate/trans-cinnamate dioxygenase ferredoxin subunit
MFNYKEIDSANCEYIPIADVEELPIGERIFFEIDDRQIVVINVAGSLFAIGDICSHDGGPVGEGDIEDYEIICPRHGARFDLRTGEAVGLPAIVDIPAYPVRIVNGKIEIGLPPE